MAVILYLSGAAMAQTSPAQTADTTSKKERTHFIAGLAYNSSLNYYGRVDSLKSSGIYPFVGLEFKNGLFLNSSFVFTHNSLQTTYAATLVEGGYNIRNKKENWAGTISAARYFYRDNSDLVQSAIKGSAGLSASYLNKIVNITVGADARFSNSVDIVTQAGVDHIIRFEKVFGKGIVVIDPSAYVHAGTQNFTSTYYQQKNLLIFPVAEEEVTKNSKKFNILAYEFSAPFIYAIGKMRLMFIPAYTLPQHIITVPGRPDLSEHGDKLFYFTAAVRFSL